MTMADSVFHEQIIHLQREPDCDVQTSTLYLVFESAFSYIVHDVFLG